MGRSPGGAEGLGAGRGRWVGAREGVEAWGQAGADGPDPRRGPRAWGQGRPYRPEVVAPKAGAACPSSGADREVDGRMFGRGPRAPLRSR